MLYDMASGPPEPGSLLESVCMLMAKKRRETEFFRTKLLVEATLSAQSESGEAMTKAYNAYRSSMFPFLDMETKKEQIETKKLLDEWIGKRAFRIKPLWRASDTKGVVSRLRRGVEKVRKSEEDRKKLNLVRI